jgi:TatD DNase family protein
MAMALDMHAHVQPSIAGAELHRLGACVIAMTRSLAEYAEVGRRDDPVVGWGVGCHPGLARAMRGFSPNAFQAALPSTPFVGEVGLDGGAKVPLQSQEEVFDLVIGALTEVPRIVSVHSYRATSEVLKIIDRHRPKGVVLHWWLGSEEQTRRAVEMGAYFSINASQVGRWTPLRIVPSHRLLTETDHPFGDRREATPQRPGNVAHAERRLGESLGRTPNDVRRLVWTNFSHLAADTGVEDLLPRQFQVQMLSS